MKYKVHYGKNRSNNSKVYLKVIPENLPILYFFNGIKSNRMLDLLKSTAIGTGFANEIAISHYYNDLDGGDRLNNPNHTENLVAIYEQATNTETYIDVSLYEEIIYSFVLAFILDERYQDNFDTLRTSLKQLIQKNNFNDQKPTEVQ